MSLSSSTPRSLSGLDLTLLAPRLSSSPTSSRGEGEGTSGGGLLLPPLLGLGSPSLRGGGVNDISSSSSASFSLSALSRGLSGLPSSRDREDLRSRSRDSFLDFFRFFFPPREDEG
uniref:Uncharacterized protein n=1 Tax=Cacopsylla melanoneura TaxID=428564 RepID=A0A8D8LW09_9HEMI